MRAGDVRARRLANVANALAPEREGPVNWLPARMPDDSSSPPPALPLIRASRRPDVGSPSHDLAAQLSALKDRALDGSAEGITIADARLPDRPLIYVNEGFGRLTGYTAETVVRRNCRFLQGPATDPDAIAEIHAAVAAGRECIVELLNYRRDGTPFWNRLSITPIRNELTGEVTHFIGIQSDVSARREAEAELRRTKEQLEKDLRLAAITQ